MKSRLLLFAALVVFPLFLVVSAFTSSDFAHSLDGSREGEGMWSNTGSPGDSNEDCSSCHTAGGTSVENSWMTFDIPGSGYVPGQTYTGTISVIGGSPSTGKGFSVVAENSSNAHAGSMVVTDATNTSAFDGHVTHTEVGSDLSTWSFDWTAPSSGTGDVTFYTSILKNGFAGGVVTASASFGEASVGVEELAEESLRLFPNPVINDLRIDLPVSTFETATISIFSTTGQRVLEDKVESFDNVISAKYDLTHLSSGIYIAQVDFGNARKLNRKFLVK